MIFYLFIYIIIKNLDYIIRKAQKRPGLILLNLLFYIDNKFKVNNRIYSEVYYFVIKHIFRYKLD